MGGGRSSFPSLDDGKVDRLAAVVNSHRLPMGTSVAAGSSPAVREECDEPPNNLRVAIV
jgi:hypothetical protein